MFAFMTAHIDELASFSYSPESGLYNRRGMADKGYNGAVGGLARVRIQQTDSFHGLDLAGDLPDDIQIPALTKVWDAFDDLLHGAI
jgi:hypothetical protein